MLAVLQKELGDGLVLCPTLWDHHQPQVRQHETSHTVNNSYLLYTISTVDDMHWYASGHNQTKLSVSHWLRVEIDWQMP